MILRPVGAQPSSSLFAIMVAAAAVIAPVAESLDAVARLPIPERSNTANDSWLSHIMVPLKQNASSVSEPRRNKNKRF